MFQDGIVVWMVLFVKMKFVINFKMVFFWIVNEMEKEQFGYIKKLGDNIC